MSLWISFCGSIFIGGRAHVQDGMSSADLMRIQLKLLIPISANGWIEFMQLDSLHLV